ncbi:MAG: hypothetical protein AAB604_01760 [Patescibacteria group bacterium]
MNLDGGEDSRGGLPSGIHKKLLPSDGSLQIVEVDITAWAKKLFDAQQELFCRSAILLDASNGPGVLLGFHEIQERLCRYIDDLNQVRWGTLLQKHMMDEANLKFAARNMGFLFDPASGSPH